jgi:poly(3-hydroxybutyrate) depolymerase
MGGDKLRFQVIVVDGSYRASCQSPAISAGGARLVTLRRNVAKAIGAACGEPRPFSLMVGTAAPAGPRKLR